MTLRGVMSGKRLGMISVGMLAGLAMIGVAARAEDTKSRKRRLSMRERELFLDKRLTKNLHFS